MGSSAMPLVSSARLQPLPLAHEAPWASSGDFAGLPTPIQVLVEPFEEVSIPWGITYLPWGFDQRP